MSNRSIVAHGFALRLHELGLVARGAGAARAAQETAALASGRMQISPEQGQFMALLVRLIGRAPLPRGGRVHRLFVAGHRAGAAGRRPDRRLRRQRGVDRDRPPLLARAGVAHRIDLRLAPALRDARRAARGGLRDASTSPSSTRTRAATSATTSVRCGCCGPAGSCWSTTRCGADGWPTRPSNDADTVALRPFNESLHRDERVDL